MHPRTVVKSCSATTLDVVGRRGLEPRTYGLKAFPITPHTAEYQVIATDSGSPLRSQNHPGPSRKGHHPEHERAM